MNQLLYTIGYTGFSLSDFLNALKSRNINVVIDVRSSPFSERYKDYNKSNLEQILPQNEIYYRNYAREFGARQANPQFSPNGYLDFEIFASSPQFSEGISKIRNSLEKGYQITLLCAEKEPINCHRTILVARAFSRLGYEIRHIIPNQREKTQQDIEAQLLTMYYPLGNQLDFFAPPIDESEMLSYAYRKQNEKIGYHMEDEDK